MISNSRQVSAVLVIPEEFTLSTLQDGRAQVELLQQQNNLNALIDQQAVELAVARISSLVDIANTSAEVAENISPVNSKLNKGCILIPGWRWLSNLWRTYQNW